MNFSLIFLKDLSQTPSLIVHMMDIDRYIVENLVTSTVSFTALRVLFPVVHLLLSVTVIFFIFLSLQCLVQARTAIEVDFQEVCEESSIIDKLYTLDIMCAEQGIVDGTNTAAEYVF